MILNLQTYKLKSHIFPAGRPFSRTYKLTNLLRLFFPRPDNRTYKLTNLQAIFSQPEDLFHELTNLQTYLAFFSRTDNRTYKLTNLLGLFFLDRRPNLQTYKLTGTYFPSRKTFFTNLLTYRDIFFGLKPELTEITLFGGLVKKIPGIK